MYEIPCRKDKKTYTGVDSNMFKTVASMFQ